MNKSHLTTLAASLVALPTRRLAQALRAPVIAVVDVERSPAAAPPARPRPPSSGPGQRLQARVSSSLDAAPHRSRRRSRRRSTRLRQGSPTPRSRRASRPSRPTAERCRSASWPRASRRSSATSSYVRRADRRQAQPGIDQQVMTAARRQCHDRRGERLCARRPASTSPTPSLGGAQRQRRRPVAAPPLPARSSAAGPPRSR